MSVVLCRVMSRRPKGNKRNVSHLCGLGSLWFEVRMKMLLALSKVLGVGKKNRQREKRRGREEITQDTNTRTPNTEETAGLIC